MNNDKAIALLRRMQEPEAYEPQITAEAFEALDVAIKALEQADHFAEVGKKATQPEPPDVPDTNVGDTISRQAAIDEIRRCRFVVDAIEKISKLPSAQPEIVRCCKCGFWDRDTLRHQFNDFRDWNEAECKILAERDPYHEINRYTEADDFCGYAERRTDEYTD